MTRSLFPSRWRWSIANRWRVVDDDRKLLRRGGDGRWPEVVVASGDDLKRASTCSPPTEARGGTKHAGNVHPRQEASGAAATAISVARPT